MYCFAKEGGACISFHSSPYVICHISHDSDPPRPENVVIARLDSTTVSVSWAKLTLVELKGLATYVVTYSLVVPSGKRQLSMIGVRNVSWTENRVFISDLQPGAEYGIAVRIVNLAGTSGIETN